MKFSNDHFKTRRGGTSKWLMVSCRECQADLFVYQKDGTGQLLRIYLDRIFSALSGQRPYKGFTEQQLGALVCLRCDTMIGVPMTYKKYAENRLAERIVPPGPILRIIEPQQLKIIKLDPITTIRLLKPGN